MYIFKILKNMIISELQVMSLLYFLHNEYVLLIKVFMFLRRVFLLKEKKFKCYLF